MTPPPLPKKPASPFGGWSEGEGGKELDLPICQALGLR